ncbi:MAG: metallophosphoesterase [candidate division WS1 bacterium]|nr:metallophosphoesterase [candidate division WS1 bacterium]
MIAIAIVLWALVVGAIIFVAYIRYVEPARMQVTETVLHFEDLPEALRGLTIAHLSDTHCHHDSAIEWSSREAVRLAMERKPDLIVITGDLFESCELASECSAQLEGLEAPLGVWAVPGNHDCAHEDPFACLEAPPEDVEVLREALEGLGIVLLANENRRIEVDDANLAIAGVDEYAFGRDDVESALEGAEDAAFVVLLAHTPDVLDDPDVGAADLVLCGHTHGGQIRLPGIGAPWAPVWRDRRRASGLLRTGDALCYVSRGVASATRARFHCRPEVAMLTLERGRETAGREVPVRREIRSRKAVEEVLS